MSDVVYTPRRTTWAPKWNGNALGTTMEVDPALKLQMEPITRGTTGKIVLGYWITGLEGSIKCTLPDISSTLLTNLLPFTAGAAGGSAPLHPVGFNVNLYSLAQELVLHPVDLGADVSQDLHFPKSAPVNPVNVKRDGTKDDLWQVEFVIFPDLSQLIASSPKVVMGYMGATAP